MKLLSPLVAKPFNARRRRDILPLGLFVVLGLSLGGCKTPAPAPTPTATEKAHPTAKPTRRAMMHPTRHRPASVVFGVKTQRKVFALTFDDGPDPTWTPQVLTILKQWHAPATFFMVGKMVRAHAPFALQVKAEGYPIGNHTWSHPRAPRSPQDEIERTNSILQKKLQITPTLFRPPYGILNNGLAKVALARGENVIVWNAQGADWDKHATAETIEAKVLKRAKPGGIVLLHDGGGNRSRTVAALPHIIDTLRRLGYRFVTIPELLTIGPPLHTPPYALLPPKMRLKHIPTAPPPKSQLTPTPHRASQGISPASHQSTVG